MILSDIKYLEFDEVVLLRTPKKIIFGKVKGIDTWSFKVRLEIDEKNCFWFPPSRIERVNNDIKFVKIEEISTEEILKYSNVKSYKDKIEKLKKILNK